MQVYVEVRANMARGTISFGNLQYGNRVDINFVIVDHRLFLFKAIPSYENWIK